MAIIILIIHLSLRWIVFPVFLKIILTGGKMKKGSGKKEEERKGEKQR